MTKTVFELQEERIAALEKLVEQLRNALQMTMSKVSYLEKKR